MFKKFQRFWIIKEEKLKTLRREKNANDNFNSNICYAYDEGERRRCKFWVAIILNYIMNALYYLGPEGMQFSLAL